MGLETRESRAVSDRCLGADNQDLVGMVQGIRPSPTHEEIEFSASGQPQGDCPYQQ